MNGRATWPDEIFGPLVKSYRSLLSFRRDRAGYGLIRAYQNVLIVSNDNKGGA
jgi:hypothetical protein